MSDQLREITFFQFDWDEDEVRERKLRQLKEDDGLEYVRHEPIPDRPEYRVYFREINK